VNKLDKIDYRLDSIDQRLDCIDQNLDRHMKRSDLLEAQVSPMLELRTEIKGIVKLIKFIGILAGILECIRLFLH
jgi:hypothetical protein